MLLNEINIISCVGDKIDYRILREKPEQSLGHKWLSSGDPPAQKTTFLNIKIWDQEICELTFPILE